MDGDTSADTCVKNIESEELIVSGNENGTQELEITMKVLTDLEMDLACSSEKLVNFHVLLMRLLAQENELEAMSFEDNCILENSILKALAFDLLSSFLDSEVRELGNFMDTLQAEIVDARHKLSSCRHLREELATVVEKKLRDSEDCLKQSRKHIFEVINQSAKLQRIIFALGYGNWIFSEPMDLSEMGQLFNANGKSKTKMTEQQRHILRMLEKSLERELDLEKKLSESRQREEDLRIKLHYTEQVAIRMEEAAEVVWGRFLEAENGAEVLMGISKELIGRLQLVQFSLNGSIQRENEMKSKFQDWMEQLKAKDLSLQMLERSNEERITKNAELIKVFSEEVKSLEQQLKESKNNLKDAYAANEASQEQLNEMENLVESLKESVCIAESRAESAETKVAQITDTNLELTEELNFLKESASSKEKKVGALEKQLRELENQLQNAKASSEASQEQQNMLYSAIWDMETLIEDLKSKVSKAESKVDTTEDQCILLSETNAELNNELNSLRDRVEFLETSLDQVKNERILSAKEINVTTKFIKDMVLQLTTERERIQKQLSLLTSENTALVKKLQDMKNDATVIVQDYEDGDERERLDPESVTTNATSAKISKEIVKESLHKSYQSGG